MTVMKGLSKLSCMAWVGLCMVIFCACKHQSQDQMMFGDTSRIDRPFSKDPHVIRWHDYCLMYYSIPPSDKDADIVGWGIGIARSTDLVNWEAVGEIVPEFEYEAKGLCAPSAMVINDTVHLFYQTYGNWEKDAICHATSIDGLSFTKNTTNPVFRPKGDWTVGRAIDAEIAQFKGKYYLYFATRDTTFKIQYQGVAVANGQLFDKGQWKQLSDGPVLKPEYPWEGDCVEGASIIQKGDSLYMFYAGAYNNRPQQVGVAISADGINWRKMSNKPFLTNGDPGSWNNSESGHPHLFKDRDGRTYLFYQGNNDQGRTWFISQREVFWNDKGPYLKW